MILRAVDAIFALVMTGRLCLYLGPLLRGQIDGHVVSKPVNVMMLIAIGRDSPSQLRDIQPLDKSLRMGTSLVEYNHLCENI